MIGINLNILEADGEVNIVILTKKKLNYFQLKCQLVYIVMMQLSSAVRRKRSDPG